ncbi:hypothetical protein [Tissierella creatinophila]|uniref:Uncharacterized protein n=1 Tax=Tissierella creatinophila DSM 6911 TaxID=1123403 RepID=A0A1U7M7E5_TISCR|nr:hypothetical protein [Tissierella creatinophila]OLS03206.1 hypothetical protein TICRE_09070 [Tissierella creatinophila DSM 6911]
MKKKLETFIENIFSLSLIIAILGGGVIFLMFVIGLIIGGTKGEILAVNAAIKIMPYFIRLASIAVLSGLIWTYINGKHSLSMEDKS